MTDFDWYTTGIWHHGIRITTFFRCCDDLLPLHLRRYTMQSFEDPAGWNMGIVDGRIGKVSVSAGGIFHTEILMVCMLPLFEPILL